MILSKSGYISGLQCPKRLWLQKNGTSKNISNKAAELLELGHEVGDAALQYFGQVEKIEQASLFAMVGKTKKLLTQREKAVAEAAFIYNECYCQADVVTIEPDGSLNIFEVKSTTRKKPEHVDDMAFQYYVISHSGYKINMFYHMRLNSDFVGETGQLNVIDLFEFENVTNELVSMQPFVENKINELQKIMTASCPNCKLSECCKSPHECEFIQHCKNEQSIPEYSVLDIVGMGWKKKVQLINNGIITMKDYYDEHNKNNVSCNYLMQAAFEANNIPMFIDKNKVKKFLSSLQYPLYYLDFESFQQDVPLFDEVKPYQQVPFQYSLHYQLSPRVPVYHLEYLADCNNKFEDPRVALVEQLCSDIPDNATIMAYNVSFEKSCISNMAKAFPKYSDKLICMTKHFVDLMIPFKNKDVYMRAMKGSYSIKYVLPALFPNDSKLDYHNLDMVQNGQMAMDAFKKMNSLAEEERQYLRHRLLKYCELDTYAMVKIVKWLYDHI